MKRNKFWVLLLSILAISFAIPAFTVQTAPSNSAIDPLTFDIGPKLRDPNFKPEIHDEILQTRTLPTSKYGGGHEFPYYDVKIMIWYDDITGLWLDYFYLVHFTDKTEIWMAHDLQYPEPTADGTTHDGNPVDLTLEDIEAYTEEFDTHIYPTVTGYYGNPDPHDGTYAVLNHMLGLPDDYYYSSEGKFIIQISNIGDPYYYDDTYPIIIAGFYWGLYEYYFDRNIFNINADFWDTYLWPDEDDTGYVGTTAHELQHLIHDDYNGDDDTFMNEACSVYSETLCGYGIPWGDINWYLATPDNSLTMWGDQGGLNIIADYGAVYLWAMYLNDHFGSYFLGNFVQAGIPGIAGLEALMGRSFNSVFRDWSIANLIHTNHPGHGRYNYKSLDLSEANPLVDQLTANMLASLPVEMFGTDFGNTYSILGDDTLVSELGMYGSDYIRFTNLDDYRGMKLFMFNGEGEIFPPNWELQDGIWYSNTGDELDLLLSGETYVDPADPTLTFTTYWDIEDFWDFGFVQVSTDGGETWTSLANEYTFDVHDPDAMQRIVDNLPGLTSWSVFFDPDGDGWITMDFDLSAYAGQNVMIGFRFMTDWATHYEGWYVTDVTVSGATVDLTPQQFFIDWMVTLVYYKEYRRHGLKPFKVKTLKLCDCIDFGMRFFGSCADEVVAIITPIDQNNAFTDYWFAMVPLRCWWM